MNRRPASRYSGIVPPLVTPLSQRDVLDVEGLQRLLRHVIDGGVSSVFILGSTGEAPSLSYRLRREMISQTVRIVDGRVPVLVGVTDTAFVESVELAKYAADSGADAAVLTTPYYFPAGQTELTAYIRNIAPLIPLPLMLYNMPGLTKVWFEVETLRTLSTIDSIIGVKDSSGDLEYFAALCGLKAERPDWSILIGSEAKLAEAHALGSDGGVTGGANVAPRFFVDSHRRLEQIALHCDRGNPSSSGVGGASTSQQPETVLKGDPVAADKLALTESLQQIVAFQEIYEVGKYASRHVKATKTALSLLHICSDLPADPFHRFLAPEREQVARVLRRIGILE